MKDQAFRRQCLLRPPTLVSMQLWTFLLGTLVLGVGRVGRVGSPSPCLGWAPYSLIRALHLRRPGGPPHIKLAVEWDVDTKER